MDSDISHDIAMEGLPGAELHDGVGGFTAPSSMSEVYAAMVADVDVDPSLFLQALEEQTQTAAAATTAAAHDGVAMIVENDQPRVEELGAVSAVKKSRDRSRRVPVEITRMTTRKRSRDSAAAESAAPMEVVSLKGSNPRVEGDVVIEAAVPADDASPAPAVSVSSGNEEKAREHDDEPVVDNR
jgi:hypothetical protein